MRSREVCFPVTTRPCIGMTLYRISVAIFVRCCTFHPFLRSAFQRRSFDLPPCEVGRWGGFGGKGPQCLDVSNGDNGNDRHAYLSVLLAGEDITGPATCSAQPPSLSLEMSCRGLLHGEKVTFPYCSHETGEERHFPELKAERGGRRDLRSHSHGLFIHLSLTGICVTPFCHFFHSFPLVLVHTYLIL